MNLAAKFVQLYATVTVIHVHIILALPIPSMHDIFTHLWLISMVNVGKDNMDCFGCKVDLDIPLPYMPMHSSLKQAIHVSQVYTFHG